MEQKLPQQQSNQRKANQQSNISQAARPVLPAFIPATSLRSSSSTYSERTKATLLFYFNISNSSLLAFKEGKRKSSGGNIGYQTSQQLEQCRESRQQQQHSKVKVKLVGLVGTTFSSQYSSSSSSASFRWQEWKLSLSALDILCDT